MTGFDLSFDLKDLMDLIDLLTVLFSILPRSEPFYNRKQAVEMVNAFVADFKGYLGNCQFSVL